jgi:SAM-dependent methyltransferase
MLNSATRQETYTTKEHWDAYFQKYQPTIIRSVFFADLFERHLSPDPARRVLEIGCAGGEYLCYFAKHFGFQPFGVDYSDEIRKTAELFEFNGQPRPTLIQEDFFKWQTEERFDVVCSFGFIEHFDDPGIVIQKHVDLLAPGGKLIITLPHFAHLQYFFHWLLDRENLAIHNTRTMRLGVLRKALVGVPVSIDYLNYYQTFGFWTERKQWNRWQRAAEKAIQTIGKIAWKCFGFNYPNFLLSPHIVLVASKLP